MYRVVQPPEAGGYLGSPVGISTGHPFGQALVPRPERREQFLLPPWQFCRGGRPVVVTVLWCTKAKVLRIERVSSIPAVRVLTLRVCGALSRERSERDEQHLEHVRERVF